MAYASGRWSVDGAEHNSQGQALMRYRQQVLSAEALRWQEVLDNEQTLPGARHMARQALDSMRALEQLYRREEHLWTFYHLLNKSFRAREAYISEHNQRAFQAQQYAAEIEVVDKQLARLRPSIVAAMNESGILSARSDPLFTPLSSLSAGLHSGSHADPRSISFSPQH